MPIWVWDGGGGGIFFQMYLIRENSGDIRVNSGNIRANSGRIRAKIRARLLFDKHLTYQQHIKNIMKVCIFWDFQTNRTDRPTTANESTPSYPPTLITVISGLPHSYLLPLQSRNTKYMYCCQVCYSLKKIWAHNPNIAFSSLAITFSLFFFGGGGGVTAIRCCIPDGVDAERKRGIQIAMIRVLALRLYMHGKGGKLDNMYINFEIKSTSINSPQIHLAQLMLIKLYCWKMFE